MKEFLEDLKNGIDRKKGAFTPIHLEPEEPKLNRGEILRYAGFPAAVLRAKGKGKEDESFMEIPSDEELSKKLEDVIVLTKGQLTFRISYVCAKIDRDADGYPVLPFEQHSSDLKRNLENCKGVIIFAATIGAGIDRLIRRYERTSPATGILLQGIGAERVESMVDAFNELVKEEAKKAGLKAHPRYSPGYGDLPITVQPHLLKLVDAERRLGITLNASLMMSPSKSVTAIIGIE
ncbi:MAG: hypothetical protein IKN35_03120 [Lachnospiraceae bacterium]|nr:hypothetical protein [Lachnospiraceae bacterium]